MYNLIFACGGWALSIALAAALLAMYLRDRKLQRHRLEQLQIQVNRHPVPTSTSLMEGRIAYFNIDWSDGRSSAAWQPKAGGGGDMPTTSLFARCLLAWEVEQARSDALPVHAWPHRSIKHAGSLCDEIERDLAHDLCLRELNTQLPVDDVNTPVDDALQAAIRESNFRLARRLRQVVSYFYSSNVHAMRYSGKGTVVVIDGQEWLDCLEPDAPEVSLLKVG